MYVCLLPSLRNEEGSDRSDTPSAAKKVGLCLCLLCFPAIHVCGATRGATCCIVHHALLPLMFASDIPCPALQHTKL